MPYNPPDNKSLHINSPLDDEYKIITDEDGNNSNVELKNDGSIRCAGELTANGDVYFAKGKKIYLAPNIYMIADADQYMTYYINDEYTFRIQNAGSVSYIYYRDAIMVLNNAGTTYMLATTDSGEDLMQFVVGSIEQLRITEGTVEKVEVLNSDLEIDAAKKFYLDGGGDTYIHESSGDRLELVAGGEIQIRMTENGGGAADTILLNSTVSAAHDFKLTNGKKLYIDGGFNTYIYQSADGVMEFYCDDDLVLKLVEAGNSGNMVYMGTSGAGFTQFEPTYNATDTNVYFNRNGNKGFATFGSGNITDLNLYFPNASCNCSLVIKQDGTGSRTVTNWKTFDQASFNESTVKWPGGSAPTLSTGANAVDIISFYWDNDNHTAYGVASLNFS